MPSAGGTDHIHAIAREMPYIAPDYVELLAGVKADAVQACPESFEIEALQNDPVVDVGVDVNASNTRNKHARFDMVGEDGDRFGDRDGAKAARIQNINFA